MKRNSNITYKEIAKEAKVSLGTLSRYFNGAEISPVRAKRIEAVVNKYNYVKNFAAASIRSKSKLSIILRSRFSSYSQDNIVEGFVSLNGADILIRYYNENNFEEIINWSLSLHPKNIVILSDGNLKKHKELILKSPVKVVIYNDILPSVSSVNINFNKVFQKLSNSYDSQANIIVENHNFANPVVQAIERNFDYIKKSKRLEDDMDGLILFENNQQYIKHVPEINNLSENKKVVQISYYKFSGYLEPSIWIFIDYFLVGVAIAKNMKNEDKKNIFIEPEIKNK